MANKVLRYAKDALDLLDVKSSASRAKSYVKRKLADRKTKIYKYHNRMIRTDEETKNLNLSGLPIDHEYNIARMEAPFSRKYMAKERAKAAKRYGK